MNTKELAFKVREDIDNNIYSFGETIPSERELATRYEINRASVKTAIDTLVYEGYLYKIRGSGTYVIKTTIKTFKLNSKVYLTYSNKKASTHLVELLLLKLNKLDITWENYFK